MVWTLPKDLSALQSAEFALRNCIGALERSIDSLQAKARFWELLLPWFTGMVVVGLLLDLLVVWWERSEDIEKWRLLRWLPERPSAGRFLCELAGTVLIFVGVAGEFWAGAAVTVINGNLRTATGELRSDSDQLLALATQEAGDAETSAQGANAAAEKAKSRAAAAVRDANEAELRAHGLLEWLTPRTLTKKEQSDLTSALRPLAKGPSAGAPILIFANYDSGLYIPVWNSLKDAGFTNAEFQNTWNSLPYGMQMSAPIRYADLGEKISGVLLRSKIGPMTALFGVLPDNQPITILLGDIRSAPFPSQPSTLGAHKRRKNTKSNSNR